MRWFSAIMTESAEGFLSSGKKIEDIAQKKGTWKKEGFSKQFEVAVNITASATGLVIPPSNVLIVYSLASGGVSIASLFWQDTYPVF